LVIKQNDVLQEEVEKEVQAEKQDKKRKADAIPSVNIKKKRVTPVKID